MLSFIPPVLLLPIHAAVPTFDSQIFRFGEAGVRIFEPRIIFDDLPYDKATEKYDFTGADIEMSRILHLVPEAYLVIQLHFRRMEPLLKKYPDEVTGYATGAPEGIAIDEWQGRPLRMSLASQIYRDELVKLIDQAAEFIKSKPWAKRVAGFRISAGLYEEWAYFGMYKDMPDTGKPMTSAFRRFLKERYGTDAALQKAWHNDKVTLADALPPDHAQRLPMHGYLRDSNSRDRMAWDFYECLALERDKTLLSLARAVKRNFPTRLCGAYYDYPFGTHPPECGMNDPDRILSSPDIDFLSRPYPYMAKTRHAGGNGLPTYLMPVYHRYKKLPITEADIRTHKVHASHPDEGPARILQSPEETVAVVRRDLGNMIAYGSGIQFFEVHTFYWYSQLPFDTPEVLANIKRGIEIWKKIYANPPKIPAGDVALVLDMAEKTHHGYPSGVENELMGLALWGENIDSLSYSGHSFDFWTAKEFLANKPKYPVVIMNSAFSSDPANSRAWRKLLDRPGVTTIWNYAPGLVTAEGFSDAAMEELTGIRLRAQYDKKRILKLAMTTGDGIQLYVRTGDRSQAHYDSPRVYADDPAAEIWGRYTDDNRPAMVRKKLPGGGVSIFTGVPICDSEVWAGILKEHGSLAYAPPETYIYANSRIINIALKAGDRKVIMLPYKAKLVTELFSGRELGRNCDRVELKTDIPASFLLEIQPETDGN